MNFAKDEEICDGNSKEISRITGLMVNPSMSIYEITMGKCERVDYPKWIAKLRRLGMLRRHGPINERTWEAFLPDGYRKNSWREL